MEIQVTPKFYKFIFKYNPHIVEKLRSLPERKFLPNDKVWIVPRTQQIAVEKFAYANGFRFVLNNEPPQQDFGAIPELPELEIDIPLQMTLRHYQRGGVAYNLIHKRVIIGDDMGLGKTGQAIASIIGGDLLFKENGQLPVFPCLVICPSSVKYNWVNQWQQWTGRNFAMILADTNKRNWHHYYEANMSKVFIVNYESLKKYFVKAINKEQDKPLRLNHIVFDERIKLFNSIIIDESHKVKDTKTQQAKFTKGIATGKNYIFELTGTPVINKPKDLISQLGIIDQLDKFGGYKGFVERFCSGIKEASNLKELNFLLNKYCFYRRSKQEVAKELPPKYRQVVSCEITNRKEYEDAENNLINYLRQYKDASDEKIMSAMRGQVMVQIGILKNISARGKIKDVTDFVDDTIEQGEKIVVFTHLKEVSHALKSHYHNSVSITGDDDLKARQESIRKFKEEEKYKVNVCSIKAAGTGVDGLQYACSLVSFIELPWTAADCDQAEDRLNRIGQTKPVQCIYFLGKNTIDEHIYDIIQTKRSIASAITGANDEIETSMVDDIMKIFNKKL